jgi:hypothetical protein
MAGKAERQVLTIRCQAPGIRSLGNCEWWIILRIPIRPAFRARRSGGVYKRRGALAANLDIPR